MSEILTRSDGQVADIDFKQRIIDVIAVPWEKEARIFWRGEWWAETIQRGAFDGSESRAGKIRANREHVKGATVGKLVEIDPAHERGLFVRVKVVRGPKGDELLYLAEEDMVSGSIGYRTNKGSDVILDRKAMTRRVVNGFLDHLGFVEDPAFKEAEVLAVRDDQASTVKAADGPLPAAPVLEELLRDPVIQWAMEMRQG